MNEVNLPKKTKELEWKKEGELYLLLDNGKNKSYSLDPISFLVWVQCDGKTNVERIVDIFSVNGNRDVIKAAVTGILDKLCGKGLIKWV